MRHTPSLLQEQPTPQIPMQISSTFELQLRETPTNPEHFLHTIALEL